MNRYIYGIHDPGGEHIMTNENVPGWVLFTERIGHNPDTIGPVSYTQYTDQGLNVIARLNNGYNPDGTIPKREHYADFAATCAKFVAGSNGCSHWIIGNEPNHEAERPAGERIMPAMYAECYTLCRGAIHNVPGHESDLVIFAPVAPWNDTIMDWLDYQEIALMNAIEVDAIGIHTYTHGSDPALITDMTGMNPPYQDHYYNFQVYRQFIERFPIGMQSVPVFITETNQGDAWLNENVAWVQAAYAEIDRWNQANRQQIRSLILYRWEHDKWAFSEKQGVIDDFTESLYHGYEWGAGGYPVTEIRNPTFVGNYIEQGAPEVKIAPEWGAWWIGDRPEYKPIFANQFDYRVLEGDRTQCWFIRWRKMRAGLFQMIEGLNPGDRIRFGVHVHVWCSQNDDPHAADGELNLRVGISAHGGTDPDGDVIWSDPFRGTADYEPIEIEVVAQGNAVTLWIEGQNAWELSHNDVYVDSAFLEVTSGPSNDIRQELLMSAARLEGEARNIRRIAMQVGEGCSVDALEQALIDTSPEVAQILADSISGRD